MWFLKLLLGWVAWEVVTRGGFVITARARLEQRIICRTESRLDVLAWWLGLIAFTSVTFESFGWFTRYAVWGAARKHWTHDEDCKYGKRPRYAKAAKLVKWWKVALREGLAPA